MVDRLDTQLPEALADGEQLRREFTNLTNNAQDTMPEGGRLTFSAQRVDGKPSLWSVTRERA